MKKRFNLILLIFFAIVLVLPLTGFDGIVLAGEEASIQLGSELPIWSALPFVGILLSIAIFPLVAPHFWHHHFPKISAAWALIFAIPFFFYYHGQTIPGQMGMKRTR